MIYFYHLLLLFLPNVVHANNDCRANFGTQTICWIREAEVVHLRLNVHGDLCLNNKKTLSISILDRNNRWQKHSDDVGFYSTAENWQFQGDRFNLFVNLNDYYFVKRSNQPRYRSVLNDSSNNSSYELTCILSQDRKD